MYIYGNISLNFSENQTFSEKTWRKSEHILCSIIFLWK